MKLVRFQKRKAVEREDRKLVECVPVEEGARCIFMIVVDGKAL